MLSRDGCQNIIHYSDFIAATFNQEQFINQDKILLTFKAFDKNNNERITKEDVKKAIYSLQPSEQQ